jgi:O2-independent ubiquinone biosynthesis protein UbiU
MFRMGIAAIKIEGRQRSPAYVAQVTQVWRSAIDPCRESIDTFSVQPRWRAQLDKVAEGRHWHSPSCSMRWPSPC